MIAEILNGINPVVQLVLITLLPFLELRASIPYGIILLNQNFIFVFFVCVVTNIVLSFLVWFFINYVMHFFLKIKFVENICLTI